MNQVIEWCCAVPRDLRWHISVKRKKTSSVTVNLENYGYKVSREGIYPLQFHLHTITDAASPSNVKELQSFLGLCGWFFQFVPGYTGAVGMIGQLLKKDVPFD